MREHKNFWDRNAGLYDCFMRKDRAFLIKFSHIDSFKKTNFKTISDII